MANIMSLKSLRNKTSRNGFDLSSKRNFTAKAGELLPVKVWEILPSDQFNIDLRSFTRTQPLNTAAFARMREYYDFYFVPYDLLWNKSNTLLTQMYDNPQHAISYNPTDNSALLGEMPYTTCKTIADYLNQVAADSGDDYAFNYFGYNRGLASAKLLEYLGYGNFYSYAKSSAFAWNSSDDTDRMLTDLNLNLFGLLAYQKIYADYYRDSQWEKISPSTFNVDYLGGNSSMLFDPLVSSDVYENYNMFDLRYCNWQKDLFHGVLPAQQYGDVARVYTNNDSTAPSDSFSILALRQAEFLQKWKEITQSGNKDYKEQVEKHWNVSPGDGFSELCTYLGGTASSLDINEVVNNNITGDNSADIAGKGTVVGNGRISFNSQGRYGLVMCIYHCLPLLDYTTDLVHPAFAKVNATDFAIPEFDRVGMQSVPLVTLMNPTTDDRTYDGAILGYAPRYIEYKTDVDSSVGAFKTTLKSWVMSYDNQSVLNQLSVSDSVNAAVTGTTLNYTNFKVNPNSVDSLFAVAVDDSVDTDNFLCSSFFDVKVVRNLDTDGLPY